MKKIKFNEELFKFINNATCCFTCIDTIKNILIKHQYQQVYENEKWNLEIGKSPISRF